MQKAVKYTSDTPDVVCKENLPGCDSKLETVHVCFEDGSGITVCRSCFDSHLNDGSWISDGSITIKAA